MWNSNERDILQPHGIVGLGRSVLVVFTVVHRKALREDECDLVRSLKDGHLSLGPIVSAFGLRQNGGIVQEHIEVRIVALGNTLAAKVRLVLEAQHLRSFNRRLERSRALISVIFSPVVAADQTLVIHIPGEPRACL